MMTEELAANRPENQPRIDDCREGHEKTRIEGRQKVLCSACRRRREDKLPKVPQSGGRTASSECGLDKIVSCESVQKCIKIVSRRRGPRREAQQGTTVAILLEGGGKVLGRGD